jgi:uncharacterized protein (TIGR00255 family)
MIQSMTGYGAAECDGYKIEIRSVNHKVLDVSVRMPAHLIKFEPEIRSRIREAFGRGKIDVIISLSVQHDSAIAVNMPLAKNLFEAFKNIQDELGLPGMIDIDFFAPYRDILLQTEPAVNDKTLLLVLSDAICCLRKMRQSEGSAMVTELVRLLDEFARDYQSLCLIADGVNTRLREKMLTKITEMVKTVEIDETRMIQEVAFLVQRSDITEELARLKSHIEQFQKIITSDDPVVGRRLDFLLQEMNREVNTIGSKADEIDIINLVIEMKNTIGKLREQALNLQ